MNIAFETLEKNHQSAIMSIYNYYVENSTAAFPGKPIPEEAFERFLLIADRFPAGKNH